MARPNRQSPPKQNLGSIMPLNMPDRELNSLIKNDIGDNAISLYGRNKNIDHESQFDSAISSGPEHDRSTAK